MISEIPTIASQIHVSLVTGYGADWLWCALVPRLLSLVYQRSPPVSSAAKGTRAFSARGIYPLPEAFTPLVLLYHSFLILPSWAEVYTLLSSLLSFAYLF
ncbi:hypothetical protein BDV34DRAFT_120290 [Aspergillus parasiticus]|uniref:Uncharacterized protein n=1 Tax=Aspergillus parasiticus TaxID=5067 RepID=A0A5N6DGX7_ASPPA|nr:hypothetical protein BDV34DRAFT_120290 [Aspergillus parasiticus]